MATNSEIKMVFKVVSPPMPIMKVFKFARFLIVACWVSGQLLRSFRVTLHRFKIEKG